MLIQIFHTGDACPIPQADKWVQRQDSNLRISPYEDDETPLLNSAIYIMARDERLELSSTDPKSVVLPNKLIPYIDTKKLRKS